MKVYLVGGAVRDQLLGYPVQERDWVVVGASPDELLTKGYQQVGRDFPVFLHPKTREEYALARTERKQGVGYHGFSCDFNPAVSLEDDLARRDLTINAMALDEQGRLIDPYQGQQDLQAKRLRHVSPAFVEDPVRVLRVARFAARYHHLGFKVADETRQLMYAMVKEGELAHLVAERVWQEWQKSLLEQSPGQFIETLRSCGALAVVLPELNALFGVPNVRQSYPEVDSGVHSLSVLRSLLSLSSDPLVRFAALTFDLGKGCTPMAIWPAQYGHQRRGGMCIQSLCRRLRIPSEYRQFSVMVCRYHALIHRVSRLSSGMMVRMLEATDAFRRPQRFERLLLVCQADANEKTGAAFHDAQIDLWRFVLKECQKIKPQSVIEAGYQGEAIQSALRVRRVARVKKILESR